MERMNCTMSEESKKFEHIEQILKTQRETTLKGIQSLVDLQKEFEKVMKQVLNKSGDDSDKVIITAKEWMNKVNDLQIQIINKSFDLLEQSLAKLEQSDIPFKKEIDDLTKNVQENMTKLFDMFKPKA